MIGSFVAFALYGTFGLTPATGTAGLVLGLSAILVICDARQRLAQRDDRAGRVQTITQRAQAGAADHGGRLLVHPPERRHPLARRLAESIPDLIDAQKAVFDIGGVSISRADLLAVAVTIPLVFLLTSFVNRSRLGKAMRATAQDPEAARLMGINVDTTISLTFLLGGLLAGAAGLIYALYQTKRLVLPGLHRRPDRLHGRGHGRHRQPARRRARRPDHRRHPADLRQPDRQRVDPRRGVRLPRADHGLQARRA